jgi:hypothetical protein
MVVGETAVAPADDPRNIRLITQKISECPINVSRLATIFHLLSTSLISPNLL